MFSLVLVAPWDTDQIHLYGIIHATNLSIHCLRAPRWRSFNL
uniref:Uncharacterized protein n=1 Tax=Rhizophora mucronata TaxID=61149 RepID=A0A2P2QTX5_RHIMU